MNTRRRVTRKRPPTRVDGVTVVPLITEEIEVCWIDEDDQKKWWIAQVLSSIPKRNGRVVGVGKIHYGGYDDNQIDLIQDVEFIFDKKHGRLVRDMGKSRTSECAWRIVNEKEELERSNEHFDGIESDKINECADKNLTQNLHNSNNEITKKRKISETHILENENSNGCNSLRMEESSGILHTALERIIKDYALNTTSTPAPSSPLLPYKLPHYCKVVKTEIRSSLVDKCSLIPSIRQVQKTVQEGAIIQNIVVSASCCLEWFIELAKDIDHFKRSEELKEIQFIPSYDSILKPSRAISELFIYFPTFKSLCKWLDLREESDIHKMTIRYRLAHKFPLIKIVGGTHSDTIQIKKERSCDLSGDNLKEDLDECLIVDFKQVSDGPAVKNVHCEDVDSSVKDIVQLNNISQYTVTSSKNNVEEKNSVDDYEVDKILIGSSSPSFELKDNASGTTSDVTILKQQRMTWDSSQGRFIDDWESVQEAINLKLKPAVDNVTSSMLNQSFYVSWKRHQNTLQRRLSSDANSTDNVVLGKIEIYIPSVLCIGHYTCENISKLISSFIEY